MPTRSKYKIEVYDETNTRIAFLTKKALQKSFSVRLNSAESFSCRFDFYDMLRFSMQLNVPIEQLLAEGRNQLLISRYATPLFWTRIDYLTFDLSTNTIGVDLRSSGLLTLLKDRYTTAPLSFTNTSQSAIVGGLLQYANDQAATGLTRGSEPSAQLRDRNYPKDKNIFEAIQQMSDVIGGPDFAVNTDKELDVYNTRIGLDRPDIIFRYGGRASNILSMRVNRDATKIQNEIFLRGEGQDADQLRATVDDTSSQTKYGLHQSLSDHTSVSILNTLLEHGEEELKNFSVPLQTIELTVDGNSNPQLGSYWIGDIVRLQVPGIDYFKRLNISRFRILAIDVNVDENDSEVIKLTLGKP